MDLWIRSQDKNMLVKVDNLQIIHFEADYCICNNNIVLGSYKTKERAMEILAAIEYKISRTVGSTVRFVKYTMPEK